MLGKAKARKAKATGRAKAKARKVEATKMRRTDKDKKGMAKANPMPKRLSTLLGLVFSARPGDT